MRQRIRAIRRNESGFTLIELLIVIVILGILAGVVVFAVNGINADAKKAACKAEQKTVEVAIEAFYAQKGTYPATITGTGATALVGAGFLRSAPTTTGYTDAIGSTGALTWATC